MRRGLLPYILLTLIGLLGLIGGWVSAQVSGPGRGGGLDPALRPLDRTVALPGIHEKLVGQEFCIKCHDETQLSSDSKCLNCHKEIQAALDRRAGYHYNVVVRDRRICESCHKEHQGPAAKLTAWWDQATMRAFDHRLADYPLAGAHAKVECRDCHRPQFMRPGLTQRTRPQESFIGLTTACASCHKDVHSPTLGRECERCHTLETWKQLLPDAPFDHSKTDYPLIGLHDCIPAHGERDVCRTCHRTESYTDPVAFKACSDCHADAHAGQLRDRADGGRCEPCHDVLGFDSVLYGIAEHRESRYPLEGAHRAVACNACHPKMAIGGAETVRLDYETRECRDCHTKPPTGHVVEIAERYSCRDCHTVATWREMVFDHNRSEFKLAGAHTRVPCLECHAKVDEGTAEERVRYVEMDRTCAACHEDVHAEQFAEQRCEDCHTTDDWKPTRFDHQKNSTFALEGKHREADCRSCHRLMIAPGGEPVRRFKPMRKECRACHGAHGGVQPTFAEVAGALESGGP